VEVKAAAKVATAAENAMRGGECYFVVICFVVLVEQKYCTKLDIAIDKVLSTSKKRKRPLWSDANS